MHKLDGLIDGAEMYSRICEEEDAEMYIRITHKRANHLLNDSIERFVPLN